MALNALTVRVEACEQGGQQSANVTTLRADVTGLRCKIAELKSIDISMLFGTVDVPEGPSSEVPAIFEVPSATATGDVVLADKGDELDTSETDEEDLGICEVVVYDYLEDLEGAKVQTTMEASLQDISMIGPSGVQPASGDESGTDAQIEKV
ncbi:uncharacterized protein LOC125853655 [Solanum stenotomum]|uniref:uncharacterized protein LOC125853655 n=1 Tax=Solanum stenotomum TaxID=172797 RepID=UPI0020D1505A|nr:uncharacterized protein LOC125853655 [Solanum stenotomum]